MSIQSDARPSESSAPADRVHDVIVLGAGPVGQTVAAHTRSAGLSVVLVERELVGGECSYWGCVPSKALLRPVLAIADTRRIDGAREAINDKIDVAGVFGRRDRYVTNWHDVGQANTVAEMGVSSFAGMPGSTAPDEYESSQPTNASTGSPHAMRW
jgi:pyruvate/2-oxoglutarate dehydrogenase complex dihydrolipoamide dehydrogenase (E3) component